MTPTILRNTAILCWLVNVAIATLTGNYVTATLFFINLVLAIIIVEANDHPIRNFYRYLISEYHHRQSTQSRRQRYSLFRQKVKNEPVEFESEAREVVK